MQIWLWGRICQAACASLERMEYIKTERKQEGKKAGGSHTKQVNRKEN